MDQITKIKNELAELNGQPQPKPDGRDELDPPATPEERQKYQRYLSEAGPSTSFETYVSLTRIFAQLNAEAKILQAQSVQQ